MQKYKEHLIGFQSDLTGHNAASCDKLLRSGGEDIPSSRQISMVNWDNPNPNPSSDLCDWAPPHQLLSHCSPLVSVTSRAKTKEGVNYLNIYLDPEGCWWCTLLKTCGEEVPTPQSLTEELENIKWRVAVPSEGRCRDSCSLSTSTCCSRDFHSSSSIWSMCCSLWAATADRSWCFHRLLSSWNGVKTWRAARK